MIIYSLKKRSARHIEILQKRDLIYNVKREVLAKGTEIYF